jgi:hypothetical protein
LPHLATDIGAIDFDVLVTGVLKFASLGILNSQTGCFASNPVANEVSVSWSQGSEKKKCNTMANVELAIDQCYAHAGLQEFRDLLQLFSTDEVASW